MILQRNLTPSHHLAGKTLETNQFSVTEYWSRISKGKMQMPAVFFVFDLAPITVTVRDTRGSFSHFLVRTCAVVGGVFAVTGAPMPGVLLLAAGLGCAGKSGPESVAKGPVWRASEVCCTWEMCVPRLANVQMIEPRASKTSTVDPCGQKNCKINAATPRHVFSSATLIIG